MQKGRRQNRDAICTLLHAQRVHACLTFKPFHRCLTLHLAAECAEISKTMVDTIKLLVLLLFVRKRNGWELEWNVRQVDSGRCLRYFWDGRLVYMVARSRVRSRSRPLTFFNLVHVVLIRSCGESRSAESGQGFSAPSISVEYFLFSYIYIEER